MTDPWQESQRDEGVFSRQLLDHQRCRWSESSSTRQVSLNCRKGSSPVTARILYLLRSQVRLLVSVQNGLYHFLGHSQDARRRTKPNAAQQRVVSVSECHQRCAQGVNEPPRALRDEIRVKRLTPDHRFGGQVTAIRMFLNDKGADGRAQCADKRSENRGQAVIQPVFMSGQR